MTGTVLMVTLDCDSARTPAKERGTPKLWVSLGGGRHCCGGVLERDSGVSESV